MKIDNNTFWLLFWIILFVYFGTTTYFKEQTKQLVIKQAIQIQKMQNERDGVLQETMNKMVKDIKDTQYENK